MRPYPGLIAVLAAAMALTLAGSVAADYGSADSADFPLDLRDIPTGGAGGWADSDDFALDLRLVNRGWADSSDFAFGDNPPPAPELTAVRVLGAVQLNQPFEVQVTLRNNGGAGDHGGISISFPDLTPVDAEGNMPPYNSTIADIDLHGDTTFSQVSWFDAGDPIYENGNPNPVPAQHLLVEGDEPAWDYAETQTLTVTITPKQTGSLTLRIRGWIAAAGTGYGPPTYRDPNQDGPDHELDQQLYWSKVVCVDVVGPTQPGSVSGPHSIGADALHDVGILGTGVKIGILGSVKDEPTGLPWTGHNALTANLLNGESDYQRASWHETNVAGVLAGIDPTAGILPDGDGYKGTTPEAKMVAREVGVFPWNNIDNKMLELRDEGCSVINYSGGFDPTDMSGGGALVGEINRTIDEMIDEDKVNVVCAAGNFDPDGLHVIACPANAYNGLAVGNLGAYENGGSRRTGPWNKTSDYNIPGPTQDGYGTGRCKPDLVAPGDCVVPESGSGDPAHYSETVVAGSSISAPHVAGTVALLIQAARQAEAGGQSLTFVDNWGTVDPRAIKSCLLTGADKTVTVPQEGGRGWCAGDPAQGCNDSAQPLDYALGAGGLDALEAKKVMLSESTTDYLGNVIRRGTQLDTIAWDPDPEEPAVVTWSIGAVDEATWLTATLVWNAHVAGLSTHLNNLELRVLREGEQEPVTQSNSPIDNVEHVHYLLTPGTYTLEIRYVEQETDEVDPEPFAISYRLEPGDFQATIPPDFDEDGDVDWEDYAHFEACATGPEIPQDDPDCADARLDGDQDVDQSDFGILQRCFSGEGNPADPNCAG